MKQIELEIRLTELKQQQRAAALDYESHRRSLSNNKKRIVNEFKNKMELEFTQDMNKLTSDYKARVEQLTKTMNALRAEYLHNFIVEEGGEE